jgi:hypothetical protein
LGFWVFGFLGYFFVFFFVFRKCGLGVFGFLGYFFVFFFVFRKCGLGVLFGVFWGGFSAMAD